MDINKYIFKIKKLGACEEAVLDAHKYQTSQELWADCKRGDWMLWLIGKLSGEPECDKRKKLVLTACKCARLALPYAGKNKDICTKTIETAESWAKNEGATMEMVKSAAYAAYEAADAADAAAYAADAAAYAAAYAAYAAAYAADAAAYAAYAASNKVLTQCVDIVRTDYPDVDDLWIKGA